MCSGAYGVVDEVCSGAYGVVVAEVEDSQGVVALDEGVEAVYLLVVEGPAGG